MQIGTGRRWHYVAPSLTVLWIFANVDKFSLSIVVTNPDYLQNLGLSKNAPGVGLLFTGFLYAYALAHFVWGPIVDRIGPRRVALIAIVWWGLMMICLGLVASFGMTLAFRILLGAAEGALWPVSIRLTASWFYGRERARAQSAYVIGQLLGPALGGITIASLLTSIGWRGAFIAIGIGSLVILTPAFLFLVRDEPMDHVESRAGHESLGSRPDTTPLERTVHNEGGMRTLLGRWQFWLVVVAWVVNGTMFHGLGSWLPSYLKFDRHLSGGLVGILTSSSWAVAIAAALVGAYLADRSRRPALVAAGSYALTLIAIIIGIIAPSPPLAIAFMTASLVGSGAASGLIPATLQVQVGDITKVGRASALMTGCGDLISGAAPLLVGLLVGWAAGSYLPALLFLLVIIAVGAVALGLLASTERPPSRTNPATVVVNTQPPA